MRFNMIDLVCNADKSTGECEIIRNIRKYQKELHEIINTKYNDIGVDIGGYKHRDIEEMKEKIANEKKKLGIE